MVPEPEPRHFDQQRAHAPVALFADTLIHPAFAAVVGLRCKTYARANLSAVVEVAPVQFQHQPECAYSSDGFELCQLVDASAHRFGQRFDHARFQCRQLRFRQCHASAFPFQPRFHMRGQGLSVLAANFALFQPFGELAFDVVPAADGTQQFAGAVAMLLNFFLQLAPVTCQVALCFRFCTGHPDDVHPVTFSAQPSQQAVHELDGIKPVCLGAARLPFHRDAGRVDDQDFVAQGTQGAVYPESVLTSFVAHDGTGVIGYAPFLLSELYNRRCLLQSRGRLFARYRVDRGTISLAIMQGDLPASIR